MKAAASTLGLPSRMPSAEGSTFQGPSALHQVSVSSHVVKGFIVKFTNKKIDKKKLSNLTDNCYWPLCF